MQRGEDENEIQLTGADARRSATMTKHATFQPPRFLPDQPFPPSLTFRAIRRIRHAITLDIAAGADAGSGVAGSG